MYSAIPISKLIASKEISSENIEYVQINLSPEKSHVNSPVYTYGIMRAKDVKIYDESTINLLSEIAAIEAERILSGKDIIKSTEYSFCIWCEFHMTNGMKTVRCIPVYDMQIAQSFTDALLSNDDYCGALFSLPENAEVNYYNVSELYAEDDAYNRDLVFNSLLGELKSGTNCTRVLPYYMRYYTQYRYEADYAIGFANIYGRCGSESFYNSVYINNDMPLTKLMYIKIINEKNSSLFDEITDTILNDMDNIEYIDMNINFFNNDWVTDDYQKTLYFSIYQESTMPRTLSYEQVVRLFSDFADSNIENFTTGSCYAEINLQLVTNADSSNLSLHSCTPLSNIMYEYWLDVAQSLYEQ